MAVFVAVMPEAVPRPAIMQSNCSNCFGYGLSARKWTAGIDFVTHCTMSHFEVTDEQMIAGLGETGVA